MKLPGYGMLAWRLFRDPRMPTPAKGIAVAAVLLILSPLDVLDWVPFMGNVGELALITLVLRAFINAAPEEVRQEYMAALGIAEV